MGAKISVAESCNGITVSFKAVRVDGTTLLISVVRFDLVWGESSFISNSADYVRSQEMRERVSATLASCEQQCRRCSSDNRTEGWKERHLSRQ